jgi:NADH-quinone oxidoreductase subunit F
METYLLKHIEVSGLRDIDFYRENGGYGQLKKALGLRPTEIIEIVRRSGLRGRGGTGFPTAMKWTLAVSNKVFPKYLICNAIEGYPGTFKDKILLEKNPHLVIEGMIIAAYTLGCSQGYIYLRGQYSHIQPIVQTAIDQAYEKGFLGSNIHNLLFDFNLSVHSGAGAYICGEDTALIESLEGKRAYPRLKPPFSFHSGAWQKPTIVNNVETLANIPLILKLGPGEYTQIGTSECPGTKLFSVSGSVNKPGLYELPMGTYLRDIIYFYGGGIKNKKRLKAVFPGGITTSVLPVDEIDCPMDFTSIEFYGSSLGSGAVIVIADDICMVKVAWRALTFFEKESCGKCTPCREGTGWLTKILERIEKGKGTDEDIPLILDIADNMSGKTFCPFGDSAATVVKSIVTYFKYEFQKHIEKKLCPFEG